MIHSVIEYRKTQTFLTQLIQRYDALTDIGRHYDTHIGANIQKIQSQIKEFELAHPKKEGRTFELSNGKKMCDECCNGDRCDDPHHRLRSECWYCLGSGINASC